MNNWRRYIKPLNEKTWNDLLNDRDIKVNKYDLFKYKVKLYYYSTIFIVLNIVCCALFFMYVFPYMLDRFDYYYKYFKGI